MLIGINAMAIGMPILADPMANLWRGGGSGQGFCFGPAWIRQGTLPGYLRLQFSHLLTTE